MHEFFIPTLPTCPYLFVQICMADGSGRYSRSQGADNFQINDSEIIQVQNLAIIAFFQILRYAQSLGIALG